MAAYQLQRFVENKKKALKMLLQLQHYFTCTFWIYKIIQVTSVFEYFSYIWTICTNRQEVDILLQKFSALLNTGENQRKNRFLNSRDKPRNKNIADFIYSFSWKTIQKNFTKKKKCVPRIIVDTGEKNMWKSRECPAKIGTVDNPVIHKYRPRKEK